MPANLSQEAKGKWNRVIQAKKPKEKLEALKGFLSAIPKHKGNERLRMQVKRKIAALKEETEIKKGHKTSGGKRKLIERSGAAQVALLGLTNVGKSSLMACLTNTKPTIMDYEYTTKTPFPGIMLYQDIQLQLIEIPALLFAEPKYYDIDQIMGADGLIILIDGTNDIKKQLVLILAKLDEMGISVFPPKASIEIDYNVKGGIVIQLYGKLLDCANEDIKKLLLQYGQKNAKIVLKGNIKFDDIEEAVLESKKIYKPSLILLNKSDLPRYYNIKTLNDITPNVPRMEISCENKLGLGEIPKTLIDQLGIIRVYTKEPGKKERSSPPFTLKRGAKISDLAKLIHSKLLDDFKYAKIWGPSSRYPGERVGLNHELADKDVVEIRT